jgi:hypothetical protein
MRFVVISALLFSIPAFATAQSPTAVDRLKEGFGAAKVEMPPIELISGKAIFGLRRYCSAAQSRTFNKVEVDAVHAYLTETFVDGVSVDQQPKDAWDSKYNHFNVVSSKLEPAPIEAGLVLIHLSGALSGVRPDQIDKKGIPSIVPVLIQFDKNGGSRAGMGRIHTESGNVNSYTFHIVNERMPAADKCILIFVNRSDRSWAAYRDATLGTPKNSLLVAKIDERTLLDLEAKLSEAAKANAKDQIEKTKAREVEIAAKANVEAAQQAKQNALDTAEFRKWAVLGGKDASEAKIVDYAEGVITLQRTDEKTVKVRVSRLSKSDKAYFNEWLDKAGVKP